MRACLHHPTQFTSPKLPFACTRSMGKCTTSLRTSTDTRAARAIHDSTRTFSAGPRSPTTPSSATMAALRTIESKKGRLIALRQTVSAASRSTFGTKRALYRQSGSFSLGRQMRLVPNLLTPPHRKLLLREKVAQMRTQTRTLQQMKLLLQVLRVS